MQKIVGVKKQDDNLIYHFINNIDAKVGDKVVVDYGEFLAVAQVVRDDVKIKDENVSELGKIVRIASENDLTKYDSLRKKAKSQLPEIKKKSLELGLMMKFVDAEYSLDGSKIVIVFSSEERVDFRQFLKELASMLKTRIELKQIGQRDEVKMIGGVGPCGEPCCCARFLNIFEHVTVKMAKTQGLSLAPTKINGVCGRLMCCLGYESEIYESILAKMPKINSEVKTPNGKGFVVYNDILRERVSVKRQADGDTIVVEDFALNEIEGFGQKPQKENNFNNEKPKDSNDKQEQSFKQNNNHKKFFNKNHKR